MRNLLLVALAAPLLAVGQTAPAPSLHISVEVVGKAVQGKPVSGTLRFVHQAGGGSGTTPLDPLEFPFEAPGQKELPVPSDKAWQVELLSEGYWSEPQAVPAGNRMEEVRLRLFPLGHIRGKLVRPDTGALPSSVTVGVQSTANQPGKGEALDATITCPVREGALDCPIPAGRVDLRLRAEGFTPLYLWDLNLPARESRDLGRLRLQRGASVVGWVQDEDGKPASGVRVELAPNHVGSALSIVVSRELERMKLEAKSNEKGFFQLTDVSPGRYVLRASKDGFAPVRVQPVDVRPDLEAEVIEKLRLARPVVLEVTVDPPFEPYGKPWEIELLRRSSPSEQPTDRIAGKISREGTWRSPGIPPGTYELGILGDLGTRWHSESLEIEPGEPPLHVEIPVLRIKGTVSIGDEPFPATVWLGHEGRNLRFDTDVDGSFEGLLPEEGTWRVELRSTEEGWRIYLDPVEIKPPGKNLAEVKLEVPDTRLAGEVVDPSGRPVPGASVGFFSGQRKSSDDRTNEDGEFETRGLLPGPLIVSARHEMLESESVLVQLAEGVENPRLRLVLRGSRIVEGRVVSQTGAVPGARVMAWPLLAGSPGQSIAEYVTGPDGSFSLEVWGESALLNVLVLAPGHALRMTTMLAEPGHKPEIAVDSQGGTLVFELSEGGPLPLLVRNGVFIPLQLLDSWVNAQRARSKDPRRIVVPQMEAGPYSLCAGAGVVSSLQQGGEPPAARCVSGVLSPYGELVLRSPAAAPSR